MKKNIKSIIKLTIFLNIMLIIIIILILFYKYIKYIEDNKEYDIKFSKYEIYLAIDEEVYINSNYKDLIWDSKDNDVATVNNGIIKGINAGSTKVFATKNKSIKEIEVNVSDLYTIPILNNDKEYLKCNQYSEEENRYLDNILKMKIDEVGYKTRAGAVEAARFLTLEFPYRIPYFYENGRLLTNNTRSYVDGEGRYYHTGLYLSNYKKREIISSLYGPSVWGCNLYTKILKLTTPNGLDCSGFVSWALLNGGFDVGDAGAGIDKNKINDLDDLGEKIIINKENLELKNFKVGDLFSRDGHIGILIGMEENQYYVAEALDYDLHVNTYDTNTLIESDWKYIIDLNKLYKNDGKLNEMWK